MTEVVVVQDDSSHWYVIPAELESKFYELSDEENYEEFTTLFDKYATGGGINRVQLYAKK